MFQTLEQAGVTILVDERPDGVHLSYDGGDKASLNFMELDM